MVVIILIPTVVGENIMHNLEGITMGELVRLNIGDLKEIRKINPALTFQLDEVEPL